MWKRKASERTTCKAVKAVCRTSGTKGHYEKVCLKGKCSTHLVNVPEASSSYTDLDPLFMSENGDSVYNHMASMQNNRRKHLIEFPIGLDWQIVRKSVEKSKSPTVLLKVDTVTDVNLMKSKTFDTLFNSNRSVLQPSSLKMEAYGNNTSIQVLGKFHAFLRWKGHVYSQLFYITDANDLPNLLSRDGCYTLDVIKPCYSMETARISSMFQDKSRSGTHPAYSPLGPTQNTR